MRSWILRRSMINHLANGSSSRRRYNNSSSFSKRTSRTDRIYFFFCLLRYIFTVRKLNSSESGIPGARWSGMELGVTGQFLPCWRWVLENQGWLGQKEGLSLQLFPGFWVTLLPPFLGPTATLLSFLILTEDSYDELLPFLWLYLCLWIMLSCSGCFVTTTLWKALSPVMNKLCVCLCMYVGIWVGNMVVSVQYFRFLKCWICHSVKRSEHWNNHEGPEQ